MSPVGIVLLVFFAIISFLLILLVAIQDDGENGMGGLLGGRGTAAFGSHSAGVLTKTTAVLVALFFILAVALAMVNKSGKKIDESLVEPETNVEQTVESESTTSTQGEWWNDSSEAESTATESENSDASVTE